jgi:hypothetical protein
MIGTDEKAALCDFAEVAGQRGISFMPSSELFWGSSVIPLKSWSSPYAYGETLQPIS